MAEHYASRQSKTDLILIDEYLTTVPKLTEVVTDARHPHHWHCSEIFAERPFCRTQVCRASGGLCWPCDQPAGPNPRTHVEEALPWGRASRDDSRNGQRFECGLQHPKMGKGLVDSASCVPLRPEAFGLVGSYLRRPDCRLVLWGVPVKGENWRGFWVNVSDDRFWVKLAIIFNLFFRFEK